MNIHYVNGYKYITDSLPPGYRVTPIDSFWSNNYC